MDRGRRVAHGADMCWISTVAASLWPDGEEAVSGKTKTTTRLPKQGTSWVGVSQTKKQNVLSV